MEFYCVYLCICMVCMLHACKCAGVNTHVLSWESKEQDVSIFLYCLHFIPLRHWPRSSLFQLTWLAVRSGNCLSLSPSTGVRGTGGHTQLFI